MVLHTRFSYIYIKTKQLNTKPIGYSPVQDLKWNVNTQCKDINTNCDCGLYISNNYQFNNHLLRTVA